MKNQQDDNKVLSKVRRYALQQIKSWETVETVVMAGLVIYMTVMFSLLHYSINLYSVVLFVFFLGLLVFGLYETIPAIIMYYRPFSSRAFRMDADDAEKQKICEEIDAMIHPSERLEMPDMTCTPRYVLLEGKRNFEVLRWSDISSVRKTEYPFRQRYKGVFILKFIDKKSGIHELDIHNGKDFNPVRQVSLIFLYLMEHHPEIELELSETDKFRIEETENENRKIRGQDSWLS